MRIDPEASCRRQGRPIKQRRRHTAVIRGTAPAAAYVSNFGRRLAPKTPQIEDTPLRPGRLSGSVLPTVVAVSVVMFTALLGLLLLWEQETLLAARSRRLRQARADVESAYAFYSLYPHENALTDPDGSLLFDSLPQSRVIIRTEPWGLYEAVRVRTADSLLHVCRLFGAEPEPAYTLYYADGRTAVTLAGQTVMRGILRLPQNGLVYGRVGSDFYRGPEVSPMAILRSDTRLPQPVPTVLHRIAALFARCPQSQGTLPDSLCVSFLQDTAAVFNVGNAEIGGCTLRNRIVLFADELRIDSTCRLEHPLIVARKITVAPGTRMAAQLFARDTVVLHARAVLEYPSGIFAGVYAELGEGAEVNGYAVVRDTVCRTKFTANYRQSRTARLRGLLWVDGVAQIQGIVCGSAVVRQGAYFSPQGIYKDMLYDATLLENPVTAQPLWLPSARRKEAACVE